MADDRRILAEANTTIAQLQDDAKERVALISRCAVEARRIDASLRAEREDAKVAEERAALHAKLSAMLYGIEAAPDTRARARWRRSPSTSPRPVAGIAASPSARRGPARR